MWKLDRDGVALLEGVADVTRYVQHWQYVFQFWAKRKLPSMQSNELISFAVFDTCIAYTSGKYHPWLQILDIIHCRSDRENYVNVNEICKSWNYGAILKGINPNAQFIPVQQYTSATMIWTFPFFHFCPFVTLSQHLHITKYWSSTHNNLPMQALWMPSEN